MSDEQRTAQQWTTPSTFSFPGRHLLTAFNLLHLLPLDAKPVLCLGSGPFEPSLLAHLLRSKMHGNPDFHILGVDREQRVVAVGQKLQTGQPVSLTELAAACTNFTDAGTLITNSDLNPEGAAMNFDRVQRLLGSSPWNYDPEQGTVTVIQPTHQKLIQADALTMPLEGFSAITACGLIMNLRKVLSDDEVVKFLIKIRDSGAVFCTSFTPHDLMRDVSTVELLQRAGLVPVCILADKFVILDGKNTLLGDFEAVFVPPERFVSISFFLGRFISKVLDDLPCLETFWRQSEDFRFNELSNTERVPVAWLPKPVDCAPTGESLMVGYLDLTPTNLRKFQNYRSFEGLAEEFAERYQRYNKRFFTS